MVTLFCLEIVASILCRRLLRPNPGHRLARRGPDYISRSLRPRALPARSRSVARSEATTTATPSPTASIKVLTESFVGSRGRIHNATMLYVQEDINESFADSEHAAVALMWSGSGVGKIAKDYKIKKKVSMLGNAFEGKVARTIVQFVRHLFICANRALSGIFTRFYGDRPPNILVDEGKFFIEKGTWFMSADFIDGYGAQPHKDIKRMGFERMKRFFASDANDLGATVKEIVINVCDWNQFVIADRSEFEKNADVPTAQSVFDEM